MSFADPAVAAAHASALRSIRRVVHETTQPTPDATARAAAILSRGRALVLTGAGVSTEFGIPEASWV